jgi:hypothetical protein
MADGYAWDHAGWACDTTRSLTARHTTGFRQKWRRVMQHWVSAPGDYALFNSNHIPDGTHR